MKLHTYYRSSASYRVRIALNLKGLEAEHLPVHLTRDGGEQFLAKFRATNPAALVPVLEDGSERIAQSLAIIEYLDERYPESPLLPASAADRAWVRQIALAIACDIHPLNNLRVLKYLTGPIGLSEEQKQTWIRHWIDLGLQALESRLATSPRRGAFCFGDRPTLADCCLVPQLFNAERFGMALDAYPTLRRIEQACNILKAFQNAHPANQPDAE
ncbi:MULTISPECIES: maleylacetoacetate isomerase [Hydrocarboniphaga]|uniref:Maleylacetoacetate isomerase n=1 Tax=Hydrocarboniphaga effusa AP103 TaxID=1172194 RepID=I8TBQ2_9GAMM|nr:MULTISPECIES: maleylacetoacetate isomerase [Hydrocarboniphaga]EIT71315.1 maleylacetoacetate isomerase [Hydrocarboniphaga effusa AP103]MDZ4078040.1 maleylacetoacetate isomerase [Hydrocarboniphaga sp.]